MLYTRRVSVNNPSVAVGPDSWWLKGQKAALAVGLIPGSSSLAVGLIVERVSLP